MTDQTEKPRTIGNPPKAWTGGDPRRAYWSMLRRVWPFLTSTDRPIVIELCEAKAQQWSAVEALEAIEDGRWKGAGEIVRAESQGYERLISASRIHALKCLQLLGGDPDSRRRISFDAVPDDEADALALLQRPTPGAP